MLAALIAIPVIGLMILLYDEDVWEGELPATVESHSSSTGSYRVEGIPVGVTGEPLDVAFSASVDETDVGPGVATGDRVICRVRQTYVASENLNSGPETEVLSCRER